MLPSVERMISAIETPYSARPGVELDQPAGQAAAARGRARGGLEHPTSMAHDWPAEPQSNREVVAWRRPRPGGSAELVGDLAGDRPPRYAALAAAGRGRWSPTAGCPLGTRLPAERELAAALALSRATVTAAYAPAARGRLGHRPAGRGHLRGAARRSAPRRLGAGRRSTTGRSTWRTPRPSAPSSGARRVRRRARRAAALPAAARLPPGRPAASCAPGSPSGTPRAGLPTTPEQVLVTAGALHGVATGVPDRAAPRPAAAGRAADLSERARRGAGRRPCAHPAARRSTRTSPAPGCDAAERALAPTRPRPRRT